MGSRYRTLEDVLFERTGVVVSPDRVYEARQHAWQEAEEDTRERIKRGYPADRTGGGSKL